MDSHDVALERFRTTRFDPGYDQREVDTFLESAAQSLRRLEGAPVDADATIGSEAVAAVRFTSTRFREGYHPADVDAFLERLAAAFERHERDAIARS